MYTRNELRMCDIVLEGCLNSNDFEGSKPTSLISQKD